MNKHLSDTEQRQCLLECWLPLAQQAMCDFGVHYSAAELEALIIAAANELGQATSAANARAVLWQQHLRNRSTHV